MGIISSFQTFELKYDLAWLKFENIWEVSLDQIFRPEVGPLNFKIKIKKNFEKFQKFRNFFYQNFNLPKMLFELRFRHFRTTLLSRDNLEKKNNILLMWLFVAACKRVCKQWCNWGLFSGYFPQPRKGIIFQFTKIVFLEPKVL